ncbi:hypothetical protein I553_6008 [Mycobacterium xenopi 4042]|nr:hypothetical protein I553_6008 [Mycobacterium xenopi 4042]
MLWRLQRLGRKLPALRDAVNTAGCYAAFTAPSTLTRFGRTPRAPVGPVHWTGSETARRSTGSIDGQSNPVSGQRARLWRSLTGVLIPEPPPSDAPRPGRRLRLTRPSSPITFTEMSGEMVRERLTDVFGKRYGEVLLVTPGEAGPQATVYNSFPLNDCPAELWSALDPQAIATENGAATALLNGPRRWLMNTIEKTPQGPRIIKNFGGIDMLLQATVLLTAINPVPYAANQVNRHTVFIFDAGQEVYELHDPAYRRWVMQTCSQIVDPGLSLADLPHLGARLALPDGWTYQSRVLDSPLHIDTTTRAAQVLQDDLKNSYSLLTD